MHPVSVSSRCAFAALVGTALGLTLFAGSSLAGAATRAMAVTATPQPYPMSNGDAFTYAITQTETVAYPSATPITTSNTSTESYVDACPVTFNGLSNLCDQQEVVSNESGVEDEFYGYATGQGISTLLNFYGATDIYIDGPYTETETELFDPFVIVTVYPLTRAEHFNTFDATEHYASMTNGPSRYSSVVNGINGPTGSYRYVTKTVQPKQHLTMQTTSLVRRDATGDYELKQTGYNPLSETFGAPVSVGGQEVIPVTTEGGNQLPATPPPAVTVNVPDWYPGGGAPPRRLSNGLTHYLGTVTVPAGCGQYTGTRAGDLRTVYFQLDPIAGSVWNGTQDSYFPNGVGEGVCYTQSFSIAYYDNLNSGQLLYTQSGGTVWVLTNEYLPGVRTRGQGWPETLSQMLPRAPSKSSDGARDRAPWSPNPLAVRSMHPSPTFPRTLGARFAASRSEPAE
jgi:hypothetical protein